MNPIYLVAINAFVVVWCVITLGLLWGSWDDVGDMAKTAVSLATPIVIYTTGLSVVSLVSEYDKLEF
jgi:hypothetical protein